MNAKAKDSEEKGSGSLLEANTEAFLKNIALPLEIRVHGRGGQGGVTCAKLCALVYSRLGLFAQTFGDYGMERAGAPVRAYTRIDRNPIKNRNKIYSPGHLLILDPSLLESGALGRAPPGSLVLLNTPETLASFSDSCTEFRFATVNATQIARKHGIGTSAVVIVNTTFVGAYARVVGLPIEVVRDTYSSLGLINDFSAAQEAYDSVVVRDIISGVPLLTEKPGPKIGSSVEVIPLTELTQDLPTPLKTGSWRSQAPRYISLKPPCNHACPAGNDILGFVQRLANNELGAASEILFFTQPLPSVCGRVCPAPCMGSCNRGQYDGAVNIRGLERWVGDHASNKLIAVKKSANPKRIAVVGGGPAGISAAYTLVKAGHQVVVIDGQAKLGGVLRNGIPAYRLPEEALDRDINRILALGVTHKSKEIITSVEIQKLATDYDAVIVATGQAEYIVPEFPGIGLVGVEQGLSFLNRVKQTGNEKMKGTIAVIGGGNTALDCAGTAIRCGADKVVIIYRRGRLEMPAIKEEIEDILLEGAELVLYRQPVKIKGTDVVTGLEMAEVKFGEPDQSGRRRPIITDRLSSIACDHVLIAIGQDSNMNILPAGWKIKDQRAYLDGQPLNVWLAGDLTTGDGTVAHAIGNGRKIATEALNSLENRPLSAVQSTLPIPEVVTADRIRFSCFPSRQANQDNRTDLATRTQSFEEVNRGISTDEEAQRCLSCGNCAHCDTCLIYCPEGIISRANQDYLINLDYCKGCGICVWECPRHAMEMTPKG
ncbi:MAG: FAD-dependent oxidoreductase [Desulfomonilaceae bacterium]